MHEDIQIWGNTNEDIRIWWIVTPCHWSCSTREHRWHSWSPGLLLSHIWCSCMLPLQCKTLSGNDFRKDSGNDLSKKDSRNMSCCRTAWNQWLRWGVAYMRRCTSEEVDKNNVFSHSRGIIFALSSGTFQNFCLISIEKRQGVVNLCVAFEKWPRSAVKVNICPEEVDTYGWRKKT